jgi:hypothetical protein
MENVTALQFLRSHRSRLLLVAAAVGMVSSCDEAPDETSDQSTTNLVSPDQPSCYSSAQCRPDQVCTTEDKVCLPPPGCKPGTPCALVCTGVCRPRVPAPSGPGVACRSDADCRPVSNDCDGCKCLPLGPGDVAPRCAQRPVQCFVDPCWGKSAVCLRGICALAPAF